MPPSDVSLITHSNNDEEVIHQLSLDGSPTLLPPLGKILQNAKSNSDDGDEDDDGTATTTTYFFLSDDDDDDDNEYNETEDPPEYENCSILPPPIGVNGRTKSVCFAVEKNEIQIMECDRKERAIMWCTLEEQEEQRQERIKSIRLLQDYAEDFVIAEVVANHNHTTTRGLEQWASARVFEESRQRLEIVRMSVLAEQEDLQSASTSQEDGPNAIANTSLRTSTYATQSALEKARRDADFVNDNVLGEENSERVCK